MRNEADGFPPKTGAKKCLKMGNKGISLASDGGIVAGDVSQDGLCGSFLNRERELTQQGT
jgi:hypothetical protein